MDMNGDQYGLPDLRQLMTGRTHFPVTSQPTETFLFHRNIYEPIMVGEFLPRGGGYHHVANYDSTAVNNAAAASATVVSNTSASASAGVAAIDMDQGWPANDGGNSRWPRQETLTLLEIRSRLDSKFKEANQKGPLWDEVSRIMAEEHGYQRSGKKCREKFENLYKYYKKTKEGKAGRHDGKHYRFFRQLEAICGEPGNNNQTSASTTHPPVSTAVCPTPSSSNILKHENHDDLKLCESTLSFSTSSEFETSSSENNEDDLSAIAFMMKQSMDNKKEGNQSHHPKKVKKNWKAKVKEFVDSQMKKLMETQDAWMEKTLKAIEDKEQERIRKEEEWRKQEEAKFNREHEFWAKERAWLEARDAALMEALKKFKGKGLQLLSSTEAVVKTPENNSEEICINDTLGSNRWTEPEFSTLLQLRASADLRYQETEGLWEDIAAKMASLGYDRSAYECRDKWENMNIYFNMATESNKKRKEELRTSNYFQQISISNGANEASKQKPEGIRFQLNDNSVASSSSNAGSFQVMMTGEGHWWGDCDLSLNKEKNQHG